MFNRQFFFSSFTALSLLGLSWFLHRSGVQDPGFMLTGGLVLAVTLMSWIRESRWQISDNNAERQPAPTQSPLIQR